METVYKQFVIIFYYVYCQLNTQFHTTAVQYFLRKTVRLLPYAGESDLETFPMRDSHREGSNAVIGVPKNPVGLNLSIAPKNTPSVG